MPPRLSKRQQREQEELEVLAGPSKLPHDLEDETGSEEEQVTPDNRGVSWRVGGFAALAGDDDEEDAEQANNLDTSFPAAKSKKSKKKKKKKGAGAIALEPPVPPKSSKTKPRVKETTKGNVNVAEPDFDKALAELSGKYSNLQTAASSTSVSLSSCWDAFNALLGVSLKHLDPEAELRRFFGSKVIGSSQPSRAPRAKLSVRSHIARPQPTWPPPQYRAGLSMRPLLPYEVDVKGTGARSDSGERWWTVEASPRYKGTTYEFMQCVMGGDPQLFFNLMYEMPWHADTLLQMAEVFRHREEYATAADFLSRALFAYERAFAGAFNLTTGLHRLSFDHVENRVFYLGLARNIVDLGRRGTSRTAFEFARLLFSLDPHTDPHGALLHLDYLALKAGQASWLLDMWDACTKLRSAVTDGPEDTRFDVTMMPGWCWARALALFEREGENDHEHLESTQALKDAILAFPSIAPLLGDKVDIAITAELKQADAFKIVTDYNPYRDDVATSLIHLLSHIFATRCSPLWKPPACAAWLANTINTFTPTSLKPSITPQPRSRLTTLFSDQSNLTDAVYRHITVVAPLAPEFRRLTAFFPGDVKERLAHTIEGDPLPPVTAVSAYDDAYFAEAGQRRPNVGRSAGDRMAAELHRLFPNPLDRGQFQALFDAHPEIGARFPGGAIELAQLARQFPQEVLEAMVGMVAMEGDAERHGPEDAMQDPGMILNHQREENDGRDSPEQHGEDGEDEDEDEDEPSLPVRIVQNFLGRLWGRPQPDSNSDSDREDNAGDAAERGGPAAADDVD